MKKQQKFLTLYLLMICTFVLHIFLNEQLALKTQFINDRSLILFDVLSKLNDIGYYIIIYFSVIAMCKAESGSIILESVLLGIPALLLLILSVSMMSPAIRIYMHADYCVPFGAALLCILIYRWRMRVCLQGNF